MHRSTLVVVFAGKLLQCKYEFILSILAGADIVLDTETKRNECFVFAFCKIPAGAYCVFCNRNGISHS